jgi:hypothetical protein
MLFKYLLETVPSAAPVLVTCNHSNIYNYMNTLNTDTTLNLIAVCCCSVTIATPIDAIPTHHVMCNTVIYLWWLVSLG